MVWFATGRPHFLSSVGAMCTKGENMMQSEVAPQVVERTCATCALVGVRAFFSAKTGTVCCPNINAEDWASVPTECPSYQSAD